MLTTNAARETHKHLNIRLTRRTIASEISGSSGSSEYDAAADIVEEWQRIESAASSSDVIVENLCSTPGSPAGDEPASKNTAIRHIAAIRQNKVQPTDSSEGVASISATPIVLKDDYVPYDVQDIASRDGSPRLSPTTEEAASSPPSLEKRRETFGSGEWDKVPANAEVSSSPVEDMATMINALADRIAALPAPTSSIVPANVRAPARVERFVHICQGEDIGSPSYDRTDRSGRPRGRTCQVSAPTHRFTQRGRKRGSRIHLLHLQQSSRQEDADDQALQELAAAEGRLRLDRRHVGSHT